MKHAVRKMAEEVHHDFLKEMRDQHDNVDKITKDFLKEAKERYTEWGCEPKCTERHTREFKHLHGMKHCKCPGAMTVSGDTSIIFQSNHHDGPVYSPRDAYRGPGYLTAKQRAAQRAADDESSCAEAEGDEAGEYCV